MSIAERWRKRTRRSIVSIVEQNERSGVKVTFGYGSEVISCGVDHNLEKEFLCSVSEGMGEAPLVVQDVLVRLEEYLGNQLFGNSPNFDFV